MSKTSLFRSCRLPFSVDSSQSSTVEHPDPRMPRVAVDLEVVQVTYEWSRTERWDEWWAVMEGAPMVKTGYRKDACCWQTQEEGRILWVMMINMSGAGRGCDTIFARHDIDLRQTQQDVGLRNWANGRSWSHQLNTVSARKKFNNRRMIGQFSNLGHNKISSWL